MTGRTGPGPEGAGVAPWRELLVRGVLLLETAWPRLWPAAGVAGLFVALSLLDLWSVLPGWLHLAGLVLFAAAFVYFAIRGVRGLRLADHAALRRRLERDSGLEHRPLEALEDQLAGGAGDDFSEAAWRLHRRRMAAAARRVRVGWPHAGLVRADPWGLRAALGLLLAIGLVAAGGNWDERLARALEPDVFGPPPVPAELDAWIVPPAYTGLPAIFLARAAAVKGGANAVGKAIVVPVGSVLQARVHGGIGVPSVRFGRDSVRFQSVDTQNHQVRLPLKTSAEVGDGDLAIVQNNADLGHWRLDVVADAAPDVAFAKPPAQSARLALRLAYRASDDYGLVRVFARLRLGGAPEVLELPLPLPGLAPRQAAETGYRDLTAHPWAGLPVTVELVAVDSAGQQGVSEEADVILPEREFRHPVARAIIEQRKLLALQPDRRDDVAAVLGALTAVPERYGGDVVVHLALRSAMARLFNDRSDEAVAEVQEILWDTALRLEDGGLSLAERDLRDIQRELSDALARGAADDEIERLMGRYREALDRYLQALAEQAQRQAQRGEIRPFDPDTRLLDNRDLQDMLDRARELSRSGARDAARDMLGRLQELLENLRASVTRGLSPQQQRMQQQMGRDARELRDLLNRQQRLLDETFRAGRQGGQPQNGQPQNGRQMSAQDLAGRQEALRRALVDVMRRIGEAAGSIPEALGRAERSMNKARQSLERQAPGAAVGPQSDALDQLRQGTQAMIQDMMRQMGMQGPGRGQRRAGETPNDPLGRPLPGDWGRGDDGVKIPDEPDTRRAREILQELYRRARDRARPPVERDYIDRLLKRF